MKSHGKQGFCFKLFIMVFFAVVIVVGMSQQTQAQEVASFEPKELWRHDVTHYNNYNHLIAHTLTFYFENAQANSDVLVGTIVIPDRRDEKSPEPPTVSILRLDGATGDLIWESKHAYVMGVRQIQVIDDENNDGALDIVAVLNHPKTQPNQASLVFISGKDGSDLSSYPLEADNAPSTRFEFSYLLTGKDISGDGISDLVVTDASGFVTAFKGSEELPEPPSCPDGTLYGECSEKLPFFCNEGILEERCQLCGCPQGMQCNEGSGSCEAPPIKYQLTAVGNPNACYEPDEVPIGTPRCGTIYETLIECEAKTSCKQGSEYCEELGPPWRPSGVWGNDKLECVAVQ